jgi:ribosomal protein RSM22 (predicted rRNA methylase)
VFPAVVSLDVFRERLAALEAWLWREGFEHLQLGKPPRIDRLAERVAKLSDLYTTQRTSLSDADDPSLRLAKVGYFLFSDAPKVYFVLRELAERYGATPRTPGEPWRVIDAGAGVGATSVGLLLSLAPGSCPRVELHGLDSDPRVLRLWQTIVYRAAEIAGVSLRAHTTTLDLRQPPHADWSWDLMVAQAVLNELPFGESSDPIAARADWIAAWSSRGPAIIVEPALRETSRPLHAARDRLRGAGFRILAPCPHQGPCLMLANERDWCHEVRLVPPTPMVEQVQAITRRRDDRTKFSFIAMAPPEVPPEGLTFHENSGRLVSDALNSKGKMERDLCTGDAKLIRLRLLDKDRTADNELLADAERGTLVELSAPFTPPRLQKDTAVREVRLP